MSLPSSKRRRTADDDNPEKDHISDLPEVLISDILSRLPANYAVRTSALSRTWRRKWTSISSIVINDTYKSFFGTDGIASFNCAVTRLLLRTQNPGLRSFYISCFRVGHHPFDFETWVSEVLMRNVQILRINARKISGLRSPWCFSGWNSLMNLKLEISCTLKVPTGNSFPNLKWLYLAGGKNGDIKIITPKLPGSGRVELSFPVLISLSLKRCQWLDVNSVEIQAPKLLRFTISCSSDFKSYEIKICAPKLTVFRLSGQGNNISLSAPAVTHVNLSNKLCNKTSALRAYQTLTKFPNLKCLKIGQIT